ncbi:MAG: hypothetical protein HPY66_1768 [Firmicutes bacterium]|nr:hypothetical protein [Bacillota bacterium]
MYHFEHQKSTIYQEITGQNIEINFASKKPGKPDRFSILGWYYSLLLAIIS